MHNVSNGYFPVPELIDEVRIFFPGVTFQHMLELCDDRHRS